MNNIKVWNINTDEQLVSKELVFADGQPHIELDETLLEQYIPSRSPILISARITSMDDLIKLCMVKQILDHRCFNDVELYVRYLPCRMDRRIHGAAPISVKVFTDIINSLNFSSVTVFAPHSDVTLALLNRARDFNSLETDFYKRTIQKLTEQDKQLTLLLPDVGAAKRFYEKYASVLKMGQFVVETANKHRDMSTGKLTGFEVPKVHELGDRILILDDLCDGGGTFAGLAAVIHEKNPRAQVFLAVHHGIFSKGLDIPGIAGIFTTDSFHNKSFFKDSEVSCMEI